MRGSFPPFQASKFALENIMSLLRLGRLGEVHLFYRQHLMSQGVMCVYTDTTKSQH